MSIEGQFQDLVFKIFKIMENIKYSGYNENDTSWDAYHRERGMMTNREFFTSNAPGGFYEGMEWDGEEWVPNAESRRREWKRQQEENERKCQDCGWIDCQCW